MAPKEKTSKAPRKRMGRPTKGAARAELVLGVRVTEADRDLLDAIIEDEQKQAEARGAIATRPTVADVLRALVRQEAQRRGLAPAA